MSDAKTMFSRPDAPDAAAQVAIRGDLLKPHPHLEVVGHAHPIESRTRSVSGHCAESVEDRQRVSRFRASRRGVAALVDQLVEHVPLPRHVARPRGSRA